MATFVRIHEHKCVSIGLPVVIAVVSDQHPGMVILQVAPMVKVRSVRLIVGTFLAHIDWER